MGRSTHVAAIEGLRAVAVLAVVGYHAILAGGATGSWIACGARGVDLFFTISGFCLAYPFLRNAAGERMADVPFWAFVRRRLGRIAPPYLVALLAFAALAATPFGLPTHAGPIPSPDRFLRELGLDAAFLTDGSPIFNASFWTLGIEMRWYLLFPLLLGLYARSRSGFCGVGIACYLWYFFTPWSVADAGTLPAFMLGIVAADALLRRPPIVRYAVPAALCAIALAVARQATSPSIDHGDPLWHAAAFLTVVAAGDERVARCLRFAPLAAIGVASYSIYLVHQPVLAWLARSGVPASVAALAAIACGGAFYGLVERPALRLRARGGAAELLRRGRARVAAHAAVKTSS